MPVYQRTGARGGVGSRDRGRGKGRREEGAEFQTDSRAACVEEGDHFCEVIEEMLAQNPPPCLKAYLEGGALSPPRYPSRSLAYSCGWSGAVPIARHRTLGGHPCPCRGLG